MTNKFEAIVRDIMLAIAIFVIADAIVSFYRWVAKGILKCVWKLIKKCWL